MKQADRVAEQVKRWITDRSLEPGDRLPKEQELQALFAVSKGTMREALALLEAEGLVYVRTGPRGGATISEVAFDRAFRLLHNYLYFQKPTASDLYALRLEVEPELAAGAIAQLTPADFVALEHSIEFCAPAHTSEAVALRQRQEDLHFHDILANANPNPLMRFIGNFINRSLRELVVIGGRAAAYRRFGEANVAAHRAILAAAKKGQKEKVRSLMRAHIEEAFEHVKKLDGTVRPRLILESEISAEKLPVALRRP
jgi:GntR family transcriptional regulator, transcriptional repressor for pyruvate dehydrogenase complex